MQIEKIVVEFSKVHSSKVQEYLEEDKVELKILLEELLGFTVTVIDVSITEVE